MMAERSEAPLPYDERIANLLIAVASLHDAVRYALDDDESAAREKLKAADHHLHLAASLVDKPDRAG